MSENRKDARDVKTPLAPCATILEKGGKEQAKGTGGGLNGFYPWPSVPFSFQDSAKGLELGWVFYWLSCEVFSQGHSLSNLTYGAPDGRHKITQRTIPSCPRPGPLLSPP